MLPPFEIVHRARPVSLISREHRGPYRAPYVTAQIPLYDGAGRVGVGLATDDGRQFQAWCDASRGRVWLEEISQDGHRTRHHSRRYGRIRRVVPTHLAVVVTGGQVTAMTREQGAWVVRARTALGEPAKEFRLGLNHDHEGLRAGTFGYLGLRDLHLITDAEGVPVTDGDLVYFAATHAGPGFFDTAHTGIWSLDTHSFELHHRSDLFFRRDGRVLGDHATHVIRHQDAWLVATSTWGDFDHSGVGITLTRTHDDLLTGEHFIEGAAWPMPTDAVGVWDPHLALIDGRWHVAHVAARKFFDFYPALSRATEPGPDPVLLADLEPVGAITDRTATEGTVLAPIDGEWRLLVSHGRDNAGPWSGRYGVFDLALHETGGLDAPYPTNIPWPSVVPLRDRWLLVTFDGTPYGGAGAGYGTHGDVVIMQTEPSENPSEHSLQLPAMPTQPSAHPSTDSSGRTA